MREVWLTTLIFGLGLIAFEALLSSILPTFFEDEIQWWRISFVQNIFKAMLGTEIDGEIGPGIIASAAWSHPIVLALVWAHAIIICTRVPAGEVDQGTIDVLLGLPVSRVRLYVSESFVWLLSGMLVMAMAFAGNLIGGWPESRDRMGETVVVIANLYCLYIAVGGMALLVSSLSDRRGRAVGIVFGIVLLSLLLSFVAQFWEPAKSVLFLSVMNYHRPMLILRDSSWPVADMLTLLGVGAVFWFAGALVFARRDIRTV